ncbi:MAG: hypothetical protein JSW47_20055, partial [Phycisphaerales bacterium]
SKLECGRRYARLYTGYPGLDRILQWSGGLEVGQGSYGQWTSGALQRQVLGD